MASADFSRQILFQPRAQILYCIACVRETSPGKNAVFLSMCLPHLLPAISSSYWTLSCTAPLSSLPALCDFCSSGQRFAYTFLQIPPHDGHPWCSAVSFPLLGRIRNFHPLATCAARRTQKRSLAFYTSSFFLFLFFYFIIVLFFRFNIFYFFENLFQIFTFQFIPFCIDYKC